MRDIRALRLIARRAHRSWPEDFLQRVKRKLDPPDPAPPASCAFTMSRQLQEQSGGLRESSNRRHALRVLREAAATPNREA